MITHIQRFNQPRPLPRIRCTPSGPPVRKLILRKPSLAAQFHQADAPQNLAIENRSPLQRLVRLCLILSGLGIRSKRDAMLVEDGVVKALHVEDTPRNAVESSAERLLTDL